jgi:dipeptidase
MKKLLSFFFVIFFYNAFSCTNILVTKKASVDGSVIVAHIDDDEVGDNRIVYVPAKEHNKGSTRPVFKHTSVYPRYVGTDRGPAYNIKDYPNTKPIGFIEQVEHTYAYYDSNYALMNEHQLSFGEATAASNYYYESSKDRLLDSGELARIALERCTKAKEAIILMGELAEKYGYYGWGEILLVGDTEEGWIFEICPTPEGKSALWVAQKVKDGEVFVDANMFKIRDVKKDDHDMLFSTNLFDIANREKWLDENNNLDWLKSTSPGEYNHPYYCLRRVWRLQTKINPKLNLSPWVEGPYTKEYPFSIKTEKKLSCYDVINLLRDHYEGTEFDLTKGIASGPFGDPNRYTGDYDLEYNQAGKKKVSLPLNGAWERPISVFYEGYTHVKQSRGYLPDAIGGVCWIGLDTCYTNCFMPFYPGCGTLSNSIQYYSPHKFDEKTAFWAFNFVANWACLKYEYMKKDILKKQRFIELKEFKNQKKVESLALKLFKKDPKKAKEYLVDYCNNNCEHVLEKWWDLAKFLIIKYTDGYINIPKVAENVGYPKWWRDDVGYTNGPKSYKNPKQNK